MSLFFWFPLSVGHKIAKKEKDESKGGWSHIECLTKVTGKEAVPGEQENAAPAKGKKKASKKEAEEEVKGEEEVKKETTSKGKKKAAKQEVSEEVEVKEVNKKAKVSSKKRKATEEVAEETPRSPKKPRKK